MNCIFVTDLHGRIERYNKLFNIIETERPEAVFIGGDILPSGILQHVSSKAGIKDFICDIIHENLKRLKSILLNTYPEVFVILGNDDGRAHEALMLDIGTQEIWHYMHNHRVTLHENTVYGYSYIPPSPYQLKDWERYDVSRFVDPGAISPEEGKYTSPVSDYDKKYATIAKDLAALTMDDNLTNAIFLFHAPPYQSNLDRADLDGKFVDHAPLDANIGSVAIKEFIKQKQPLITLHGHVHESARLTGLWKEQIGRTHCFSAAHDGPELALIRFDSAKPNYAERELI